jgi:hypothetical protein
MDSTTRSATSPVVECYRLDPRRAARLSIDEATVLSRPKGRAKSEIAGWCSPGGSLRRSARIRFDGWDADGQPVGRPVRSPLIKCLATEESQAGNTFENVAYIAASGAPTSTPRSTAASRAPPVPVGHGGVPAPRRRDSRLTAGSASKDGGKETFVVADESHLYVLRELKAMYGTVGATWASGRSLSRGCMQTTTAYRPGEQSVFEETLTAWRKKELGADGLRRPPRGQGPIASATRTTR